MSLVAERVRSVGVSSGASRLRESSEVFLELDFVIVCSQLLSFAVRRKRMRLQASPHFHAVFVTCRFCKFCAAVHVPVDAGHGRSRDVQ
jgi:hypothetical protein